MQKSIETDPKTLSDIARIWFNKILESAASFLLKLGIKPNMVTISGMVGHLVAAYFVARGSVTLSGIIILIMAPVDCLDGTMARLRGESSRYGAFIDSVIDRYSEFIIFGGILILFISQGNVRGCILLYLALAGSIMVSYIRARAESLDVIVKIGLLTRLERYIVLITGLIFNQIEIALLIIAVLGNFTALQRFFYVRKKIKGKF